MTPELQLFLLIILTVFNGVLIYVWIKALRKMGRKNQSPGIDKSGTPEDNTLPNRQKFSWQDSVIVLVILLAIILFTTITK